jgi:hypothetical protein
MTGVGDFSTGEVGKFQPALTLKHPNPEAALRYERAFPFSDHACRPGIPWFATHIKQPVLKATCPTRSSP